MNFGSKSLNCFWEKQSFNFEIWVTFDQDQRMTLTFDWLIVLLFYVDGKHLRSCWDGQLT